ncbi:MAG: UvrD-helicase domain-containing protein [Planctomycetota bacterium]
MNGGAAEFVEDATPHRVVRASAGTGKTHRLTNRYMALLGVGADPSTLVATTFTRKAAGEVRARVLRRLADARLDRGGERSQIERETRDLTGQSVRVDAAWCDAALAGVVGRLDRLSIGTIDAWLARMSGVLGWELGAGRAVRTIAGDSEEAARLRLAAVERVVERAGDGSEAFTGLIDQLRAVHSEAARGPVTRALVELLGGLEQVVREAPEREAWTVIGETDRVDPAEAEACVEWLLRVEDALPRNKAGEVDRRWVKALTGLIDAVRAGRWSEAAGGGLLKAIIGVGPGGEPAYYGTVIEGDVLLACRDALGLARRGLLRPIANRGAALWSLGTAYVAELDAVLAEAAVVRFEDVTDRLARRLPLLSEAERADLFYRLDAGVEHLLIDEFQDTSLEQWRVIRETAEEVMSDATTGRTFFAVGDAKQAIYGWRGGRVELFDRVGGLVAGRYAGRVESMDASYRSGPVVLEAVNRVFGALRDGADGAADVWGRAGRRFAEAFTEHTAVTRRGGESAGSFVVETSGLVERDGGEGGGEEEEVGGSGWKPAHCRHVAQRVGEMLTARPGREIAVLCRQRAAMRSMLHALRRDEGVLASGVAVSLEGGRRLADEPAVQAVLSALRLAEREDDAAAAFHVASGPIGALVGLASVDAARSPTARASAAARVRRELVELGPAGVIAAWTRAVAGACDGGAAEALGRLVAWLDGQAGALDALRPGQVVAAAEAAIVDAGSSAGVVVMTIHASKGLEFDSVVLPDLDRKPASTGRWLELRRDDDPCGPIEAVFPWVRKDLLWLDERFGRAFRAWQERQRYEELCALYVAMTRAKHDLRVVLLPRPTPQGTDKGQDAGLSKTAGGLVLSAVAPDAWRPTSATVLHEAGDALPGVDAADEQALPKAIAAEARVPWRLKAGPARGVATVAPSMLDDEEATTERAGFLGQLLDGGAARRGGSAVHALLERAGFVDRPDGVPDDAALAATAEAIGFDEASAAATIDRLRRLLGDEAVRRCLSTERPGGGRWTELWRERRLAASASGDAPALAGVVDRVMVARDAGGVPLAACVVDYKTDRRPPNAADDDTFAELLRERHGGQLHAYGRAVARLLRLDAADVERVLIAVDGPLVISVP